VPTPATFASVEEERVQRKQKLAGALRLFGRFGFSEGVAGHITPRRPGADGPTLGEPVRDELPPCADHGLILVSHTGDVMEGTGPSTRRVRHPLGGPRRPAGRDRGGACALGVRQAITRRHTARSGSSNPCGTKSRAASPSCSTNLRLLRVFTRMLPNNPSSSKYRGRGAEAAESDNNGCS
jgi:hypothetical protein